MAAPGPSNAQQPAPAASPPPAAAPAAPAIFAALSPEPAALRVALAPMHASTGTDDARLHVALLGALRLAYGAANVSDGRDSRARVSIAATPMHTASRDDVELVASDQTTGASAVAIVHIDETAAASPISPARVVALVDRARFKPAADVANPTTIALEPISAPVALRGRAAVLSASLAARLHDATGATVSTAPGAPREPVTISAGLTSSGSGYELALSAFATGGPQVGELDIALGEFGALPSESVFEAFARSSIDAAPAIEPYGPAFDVAVLPFAVASPDLENAADAARTALVDRMAAAGYFARAVEKAPAGATTFAGSFTQTPSGYHLDLIGTSGTSGASVATTLDSPVPAAVPALAVLSSFVTAARSALPPPDGRFVFVPFPNPTTKDAYIDFANVRYASDLQARGYAIVTKSDLDADEARITAPKLCKEAGAQDILVATSLDHEQEYRKGALRTFGSVLGFFTAGIGDALINGVNSVASDDRYINHANLSATFIDCNGRTLWTQSVRGENSHMGHDADGIGNGAIANGIDQLVDSMFQATGLPDQNPTKASPAP